MFDKVAITVISILVILLLGLGIVLYFENNRADKYEGLYSVQVKETERQKNNIKALNDSITVYEDKNGNLVTEKDALQLTLSELKSDYSDLFDDYQVEKNKPPKYITKYEYYVLERFTDVPTEIKGDTSIVINDSIMYDDDNWTSFNAEIPYKIINKIRRDSINKFELKKALLYAEQLSDRGLNKPFVVSYRKEKRVNNLESLNMDSVVYRVQIYASKIDIDISEIANKYKLDEEYIDKSYEDGLYKYLTGLFVPGINKEDPIINNSLLDTYSKLITENAKVDVSMNVKLNSSFVKKEEGGLALRVTSKHEGITFTDIDGTEIVSEMAKNKNVSRQLRKPFSVGLHLGVGVMPLPGETKWEYKVGPVISVGINWNPKFLQFGSSYKSLNKLNDILE